MEIELARKPKCSEKNRRIAISSTTNSRWLDRGPNPSRRNGKPATNRLIYGTIFRVRKAVRCYETLVFIFQNKWCH
jgi:hypothetical protein